MKRTHIFLGRDYADVAKFAARFKSVTLPALIGEGAVDLKSSIVQAEKGGSWCVICDADAVFARYKRTGGY